MAKFATLTKHTGGDSGPKVFVPVYHVVAVERWAGYLGTEAGQEGTADSTPPGAPASGSRIRTSTGDRIIVFELPTEIEAALNAATDTGWAVD